MDLPLHRFSLLFALVLLLPVTAPAASEFDQGVTAFKAGNYTSARKHFEAARRSGMATSSLFYNLGATYYRLGRYAKARTAFQKLLDSSGNKALAHYNLGLVARKQGRKTNAEDHFRTAYRMADDPEIRRLAGDALGKEEQAQGQAQGKDRFSSFVSLSTGYNDNVTLASDDTISGTDTDDTFVEVLASGTYRVTGNDGEGVKLKAFLFRTDYFDINSFDQTFLRFGPEWRFQAGHWTVELAGYGDGLYLDGERFETIATAEVGGQRSLGSRHFLQLGYRLSRIAAASAYDYLSGIRHQGEVAWRYANGPNRLEAGYQLEYNNRDDLALNGTYVSVSPTRHELDLEGRREFFRTWEAELGGSYRLSRYHDANVRNGNTTNTREDTRLQGKASLSRQLPWQLRVFAEYEHTRNNSNIDSYDYVANVYTLGLDRVF